MQDTTIYQQHSAPPHWALKVHDFLHETFSNRWIGRESPIPWPPRLPDITPLDFFLWEYVKDIVYQQQFLILWHCNNTSEMPLAQSHQTCCRMFRKRLNTGLVFCVLPGVHMLKRFKCWSLLSVSNVLCKVQNLMSRGICSITHVPFTVSN